MQQLSNIVLKVNVKLILEVNIADMTKNTLKNKIHYTKNRSRHASSSLQYEGITGNKK